MTVCQLCGGTGKVEVSKPRRLRGGRCRYCYKPRCSGSCADLTPSEVAYTDRLIATGVIGVEVEDRK